MKTALLALASSLALSAAPLMAATFTPTFDTPPFPGTQHDVGAAENAYYSANYGITVSNAYLYVDSRDTFDGIGIANGYLSGINTPQAGRIDFLDTTDYVTIDYLAILSGVYEAFDSAGNLVDSFSTPGGNANGTETLSGGIISYILFSGTGGYVTVSGLTYNYDGTTDGVNDDLNVVPLPAGGLLLLSAFGLFAAARRKG